MNKSEALEFIGLKEPISEDVLLSKYKERFYYFRMLYANAPSKMIEMVQQRNLEKLEEVKRLLLEDIAVKQKQLEKQFAVPKPNPAPLPKKEGDQVVGWLIIHTENRKTQTFVLYTGVNFIGRKKREDAKHSIVIEDDPYISRVHAFIKCREKDGQVHCELFDGDGNKSSANGIYLNGNSRRISGNCTLANNDTIQVGTTNLVFRLKKEDSSASGEVAAILNTGFIRIVDIDK